MVYTRQRYAVPEIEFEFIAFIDLAFVKSNGVWMESLLMIEV